MNTSASSKSNGVLDYFLTWEKSSPDAIFLRQPVGKVWREYSWKDVGIKARRIAASLNKLGISKGDRVAILSQNCAEWIICDIGMMMGGYISVPLYANVNATTMCDILEHSESKVLFVGKLLEKDWEAIRKAIPEGVRAVAMDGYAKDALTSWDDFLISEIGEPINPNLEDTLTIIYTSGTTGTPKGVMHTNASIINALEIAANEVLLNQHGNRFISYLPLSHAAERGLVECGALYSGGSISFVESQETFSDNIKQTLPTHFFGVPRIWEKFQGKILEALPQQKLNALLTFPIVSGLIRSKIKKALGLQKASVIISGAAPIAPALMSWFAKLGITIREAYGMTENFNVCTINPKDNIKIGSVGKLFQNQEVKIEPHTQEVLQRCAWLMKGYYKDPELTAATISDGFLHTGDMGRFSSDGFLTLTGRVKDIFKTSKGEYIVPAKIEMEFLALPFVDQACALGTRYPQPFVIVVLSVQSKSMNKAELDFQLQTTLELYNASCMEYQKLKKVIVVKDEWTPDNGMLTPTLKMKRNALCKRYEQDLEIFYNNEDLVAWE
jgi:long-chain acyl-CoA synthetase